MQAITPPETRPAAPRGLPLAIDGVRLTARQRDGARLAILDVAGLHLAARERVALIGPSGAGKTSLLAVLAGLVRPDAGHVRWGETDLAALSRTACDAWRRAHVGLVFQDFHLVPELDALGNILLPATFARARVAPALRARAVALGDRVGLPDLRRRASLLSRGEQQRTALARALLHAPTIILADEPTASLDRGSAARVTDLLCETAADTGATLIVATHDAALAGRLDRSWVIEAGRVGVGRVGVGIMA